MSDRSYFHKCPLSCDFIFENNIEKLMEILNDKSYNFNVNQIMKDRSTALHLAVINENIEMIHVLIKYGANVYLKDENNDSCLHLAARTGNLDLVKMFLTTVKINDMNRSNLTPLHIAVIYNNNDVVEFFIRNKARINIQDINGNTPLHDAVVNRNSTLVKMLLKHEANPNIQNAAKNSAFHVSFYYLLDDIDFLDLFLSYNADLNLKTDKGENALHLAAFYNTSEVVKKLLQMNMEVTELTKERETPLHLACRSKDSEVVFTKVCLLVDHGASINAVDESYKTPLYQAVKMKYLKVVEYLLNLGAYVDGCGKSIPIFEALKNDDLIMVNYLIDKGAKIYLKNENEESMLLVAMKYIDEESQRYEFIKYLLSEKGANVNDCDKHACSALQLALQQRDLKLFHLFIEYKAIINTKNRYKESPLYTAVSYNVYSAVKILKSMGAEMNDCNIFKKSILSTAVSSNNKQIVLFLLKNGANANDNSTLMEAIRLGYVDIIRILVVYGAVIDLKSVKGHLIFVQAIKHQHLNLIKYLLSHGANINFEHESLVPLSYAFAIYCSNDLFTPKVVMNTLMKHIAVLASLDLEIHKINITLIESRPSLADSYKNYCQELEKMKNTKICNDLDTTYHDMLVKNQKQLVRILHCTEINTSMKLGNYKHLFKYYNDNLEENYSRVVQRYKMLEEFQLGLFEAFNCILPYELMGNICKYFTDDELAVFLKTDIFIEDKI